MQATIHYAKTHLSKLLRAVARGEEVIILHGKSPVARLTSIVHRSRHRPKVGTATSKGVSWSKDAFQPLTEEEMKEWGL